MVSLITYFFLLNSSGVFLVTDSATQEQINYHLEMGKQYLAKGQLGDALSHYHEAVGKF